MTIGYTAAGGCWPTANEALNAYYSSMQPIKFTLITTSPTASTIDYILTPVLDSGVWKWSQYTTNTGIRNLVPLPQNVYGTCTLETSPGYPQQLTTTGGTGTGTPSTGTGWDGTYDYAMGTAAWTFAFITIMGCWLVSKHAGEIVDFIKRPTRS